MVKNKYSPKKIGKNLGKWCQGIIISYTHAQNLFGMDIQKGATFDQRFLASINATKEIITKECADYHSKFFRSLQECIHTEIANAEETYYEEFESFMKADFSIIDLKPTTYFRPTFKKLVKYRGKWINAHQIMCLAPLSSWEKSAQFLARGRLNKFEVSPEEVDQLTHALTQKSSHAQLTEKDYKQFVFTNLIYTTRVDRTKEWG